MVQNHRKLVVLVLCGLLLATLLSSYAFMGIAANHGCEHVHCDICEHIAMLKLFLRGVLVLSALAFLFWVANQRLSRVFRSEAVVPFSLTPVACKVRLNN